MSFVGKATRSHGGANRGEQPRRRRFYGQLELGAAAGVSAEGRCADQRVTDVDPAQVAHGDDTVETLDTFGCVPGQVVRRPTLPRREGGHGDLRGRKFVEPAQDLIARGPGEPERRDERGQADRRPEDRQDHTAGTSEDTRERFQQQVTAPHA